MTFPGVVAVHVLLLLFGFWSGCPVPFRMSPEREKSRAEDECPRPLQPVVGQLEAAQACFSQSASLAPNGAGYQTQHHSGGASTEITRVDAVCGVASALRRSTSGPQVATSPARTGRRSALPTRRRALSPGPAVSTSSTPVTVNRREQLIVVEVAVYRYVRLRRFRDVARTWSTSRFASATEVHRQRFGARWDRTAQIPNTAALSCTPCRAERRAGSPQQIFGRGVEQIFQFRRRRRRGGALDVRSACHAATAFPAPRVGRNCRPSARAPAVRAIVPTADRGACAGGDRRRLHHNEPPIAAFGDLEHRAPRGTVARTVIVGGPASYAVSAEQVGEPPDPSTIRRAAKRRVAGKTPPRSPPFRRGARRRSHPRERSAPVATTRTLARRGCRRAVDGGGNIGGRNRAAGLHADVGQPHMPAAAPGFIAALRSHPSGVRPE